jgi:hypothetical protein
MTVELIETLTILISFIAILYFFVSNDEFPALLIVFFIATGLMRFHAVQNGLSGWVKVAYAFPIFHMSDELAIRSLRLFFLGTVIFSVAYMFFRSKNGIIYYTKDSKELFNRFLSRWQPYILTLFIIFLVINSYFRVLLNTYESFAYGLSYFFLFKLAIGGFAILMFLAYRNLQNKKLKLLYLALLIIAAFMSYNPGTRFQFMSWMVALAFLIIRDMDVIKKSVLYTVGGVIIIIFFAYAGNARHSFVNQLDFDDKIELAWTRIEKGEDQNMLDGFMMVLQVYPEYLDFGYGNEHLEILYRPVPRAWWPEKPVGGYANKLGLNENMPKGITVGISQSIYGTFYGEGGIGGIILLSIIYAWLFTWLFKKASYFRSDMRFVIKGIVFASAIPLLRGGDLPGIIAFVGMSFWPVFLFMFGYYRFRKLNMYDKKRGEKYPISQKASYPHHMG